ncbi:hypothetical protein Agub_g6495, partial [Astrephomene gubernaculifera]
MQATSTSHLRPSSTVSKPSRFGQPAVPNAWNLAPIHLRVPAGLLKSKSGNSKENIRTNAGKDITTTPWAGPPQQPPRRPDSHKPAPPPSPISGSGDGPSLDMSAGMASLIALNGVIFAGAAFAKLPLLAGLALYNAGGAWWQFVTSAFVHANMAHLSRNMFLLWLWGSVLRREVGGPGVWFAYVLSALG